MIINENPVTQEQYSKLEMEVEKIKKFKNYFFSFFLFYTVFSIVFVVVLNYNQIIQTTLDKVINNNILLSLVATIGVMIAYYIRRVELETKENIQKLDKKIDTVERNLEKRMDGIEKRMDGIEKRMEALEKRMETVEHKIDSGMKMIIQLLQDKQ